MVDSASQRITDLLLQHDIDILRVAEGSSREIEQEIQRINQAIIALLARNDPTEPIRTAFRRQRIDRVLNDARRVIRDDYRALYRRLRQGLLDLAAEEAQGYPQIVNRGLGVPLMNRSLAGSGLPAIIDEQVITANFNNANTLRGFFEQQAAAHHRRLSGAILQGFQNGDTLTQMITRLRQLDAVQMREAVVVARTAFNHVTTRVRIEMMQRNSNLFRGVIAIAVLDGRTSAICISRSNGMWDLNTGRPLPESPVQIRFPGPTPWHMGERTHLYPLTRSARQIGRGSQAARRAIANLTNEQRALLNLDPPIAASYPDWLRTQPASVQMRVLGRERRQLWLEGKLNLRELVTQRGRTLTLRELERRRERAA